MAYAINEYNFWSNPKVREAGKDAALMYLAGNSYCNEFMTDGLIVFTAVSVIANLAFQTNPEKAIKALVDNHLWIKVANGYKVHDYLKYNKSKAEIEDLKKRCSTAGKASAKARTSSHVEHNVEQDVEHSHVDKTFNPISYTNSNTNYKEKESIKSSLSFAEKGDETDEIWLTFSSAFEELTGIEPKPTDAVVAMLTKFQELGVTVDEYRRAIQEMQANPSYTIATMRSPENWTLNIHNNKKQTSTGHVRAIDDKSMWGYIPGYVGDTSNEEVVINDD